MQEKTRHDKENRGTGVKRKQGKPEEQRNRGTRKTEERGNRGTRGTGVTGGTWGKRETGGKENKGN